MKQDARCEPQWTAVDSIPAGWKIISSSLAKQREPHPHLGNVIRKIGNSAGWPARRKDGVERTRGGNGDGLWRPWPAAAARKVNPGETWEVPPYVIHDERTGGSLAPQMASQKMMGSSPNSRKLVSSPTICAYCGSIRVVREWAIYPHPASINKTPNAPGMNPARRTSIPNGNNHKPQKISTTLIPWLCSRTNRYARASS